jgi:DNA-directed RNA polymerase subunit N (RpoN/RPB10)
MLGSYGRKKEEAEDITRLPPVRCMTCGKVLREKYFDTMDELVGQKLDPNDLLIKFYKGLTILIKNQYEQMEDFDGVITELGLEDYSSLNKEKTLGNKIENLLLNLDAEIQVLLKKENSIDEIMDILRFSQNQPIYKLYTKVKSLRYKPEDIYDKLNLKRPCCRTSVSFAPKIAIPSGPITGYDIEPEKEESYVEEVVEEPVPSKSDKASKLRGLLLKAKEKKEKSKEIKKVSAYKAV